MKVGIITYHDAKNHGAVLQAVALSSYVSTIGNMNNDVEIINFTPKVKRKFSVKRFVSIVLDKFKSIGVENPFWDFLNQYAVVSKHFSANYDLKRLNEQYDAFIVGSDQVWNPEAIDKQKGFFLDFADDKHPKFSYAASFGVADISKYATCDQIISSISRLSGISVRENSGVSVLNRKLKDKKIYWSPDPTLLYDKKWWGGDTVKKQILF